MNQGFKKTLRDEVPHDGTAAPGPRAKLWRVIHACEYARDVLNVVEGQVAVGMRPYIVTPQGAGTAELYLSGGKQDQPRSLSLLRSWQDVRNWRKSLLDCSPETSADLVHSHCFAAGMAAVPSRTIPERLANVTPTGTWTGNARNTGRASAVVNSMILTRRDLRPRASVPEPAAFALAAQSAPG